MPLIASPQTPTHELPGTLFTSLATPSRCSAYLSLCRLEILPGTEPVLHELTLMISPVVAGGGRKRLFADDAALTKLELVQAQPTSGGTLIATYRPTR